MGYSKGIRRVQHNWGFWGRKVYLGLGQCPGGHPESKPPGKFVNIVLKQPIEAP